MHRRHMSLHQRTCTNNLNHPAWIHQASIGPLSCQWFQISIYTMKTLTLNHLATISSHLHVQVNIMNAPQYWPFVCEYSIWNATFAALQFWMADVKLHIFFNAIDHMYTTFFYSDFTQQMWTLPEEILFGCFMTTLNSIFKTELAQEDEGYESGSESFNIPNPLSRVPRVYHVSTRENFSFDPANLGQSPITPKPHNEYSPWGYRCHSSVHCRLVFSSSGGKSPMPASHCHQNNLGSDVSSPANRCVDLSSIRQPMDQFLREAWDDNSTFTEEHFPTAPLDDDFGPEIQLQRDSCAFTKHLSWTPSVPAPAHIQT